MSIFLALILAAFLGAGWYFYKRGFNREWRQFVAGEFQKRGVEISMRQLAMVPFRGIVARDLKVYERRHDGIESYASRRYCITSRRYYWWRAFMRFARRRRQVWMA